MKQTESARLGLRKRKFSVAYKREIKAYTLLSVPILWWAMFFLVPLAIAVFFSFTNLRLSYNQITKIGFFQYAAVFKDAVFWGSLKNTFIWTVAMMLGNNILGFILAYLVSRLPRGRKVFLALLFWPTLVSAVAGAEITKRVFGPFGNDLLNMVIGWFGHSPVAWLEQESTALISLMCMPFLFGFSVKMIIYYAAITSVPGSYLEAAKLETNSSAAVMLQIVLPLVKNIIVLNMVLSLIDGLKVLGPMQLITNGANGTSSAVLYIYQLAFESPSKGKASAAAFVLFIIILAFSAVQLKLSGKSGETYE